MRVIDADKFEVVGGIVPEEYDVDSYLAGACEILEMIDNAPTVDAEPVRHGYWIPQDNTHTKFMCSDCKGRNHDGSGKYCSECGCKMDAEVEG